MLARVSAPLNINIATARLVADPHAPNLVNVIVGDSEVMEFRFPEIFYVHMDAALLLPTDHSIDMVNRAVADVEVLVNALCFVR